MVLLLGLHLLGGPLKREVHVLGRLMILILVNLLAHLLLRWCLLVEVAQIGL